MVAVESAFAVDAVERTHLTVGRLQVDAERYSESSAVHRTENGGWINDSTHDISELDFKGNKKKEIIAVNTC